MLDGVYASGENSTAPREDQGRLLTVGKYVGEDGHHTPRARTVHRRRRRFYRRLCKLCTGGRKTKMMSPMRWRHIAAPFNFKNDSTHVTIGGEG
jgi:hypothetical protein